MSLLNLIDAILGLYGMIVFASVIASWLVSFRIVNTDHPLINVIMTTLYRLTEPLFMRIRQILPFLSSMGGLDFTPVIVLLGVYFLRNLLHEYGPTLL